MEPDAMGLGPFDLTGGPFLTLYALLFVAAVVAGFAIPRWLRPEGRANPLPGMAGDADRLAFLAGGRERFGESLVARLLAAGALAVENRKQLTIRARDQGRSSAERSVLALSSPAKWSDVARTIAQDADAVEGQLVRQGLIIDRATGWQMRFWQTTPYLVLLLFGALKWEVGTMREKPVGFLTAFLIVTFILAVIRFASLDRRTLRGVEAVKEARLHNDRIRRAPGRDEIGLAVAIFGTSVLAGSAFSDFHVLRSSSGDGGSGGGGDGGGGGGCGGGGCGGCGG